MSPALDGRIRAHAPMRVQPRTGRVRPSAEGLAGFSYAHTSTGAALGDHAGTSTTHLGDFAPNVGDGEQTSGSGHRLAAAKRARAVRVVSDGAGGALRGCRRGRWRMNGLRTAGRIEGHFTMVKTQPADNVSASRPPSPRGHRAGGPHAPEDITTIGRGVVIEGDVKGGEDILIDGRVAGTIELRQHVLMVGPTGRVKAQLSAKSVLVFGKVTGTIQASGRVSIGETGSVEGAVSAPRLVMADGAHLQGRVDM